MSVASAISANPLPAHATGEVLADLLDRVDGPPSVALVFTTPGFGGALDDILATVARVLAPTHLVGVVTSGVHADGMEIVDRPALAVWCTDHIDGLLLLDGDGKVDPVVDPAESDGSAFVLLDGVDRGVDHDALLARVAASIPGADLMGGVVSGSAGATKVVDVDGRDLAGFALVDAEWSAATIWGAAPIDEIRFAEVAGERMITHLDGSRALDVVVRAIGDLEREDRSEVARSLRMALLGPEEFGVVPVLGTDRAEGAIAIGGTVSDGSLVQLLRGDAAGLHDSIIRTLVPTPGSRLLVTTGLGGASSLDPGPVELVAELSDGAVGPLVAAVISTVRGTTTLVDAPLALVTCEHRRE